jgi:very-short-patch-repair endonuclease
VRPDIEDRITAVARRQYGVVTRAQLLEAGLLPGAIRRWAQARRLRRLHRGVYLIGPLIPDRAREMAAVLACGPRALLSHCSVGFLWEMIASRGDRVPVHVTVVGGCAGNRPGIRTRCVTRLEPDERTQLYGIPVTTPARTLVDLAGEIGSQELERAVARAERAGLVDRETLSGLAARYKGRPGIPALRTILEADRGAALTRSEAEARFLELVRKARLPAPETNVVVRGYEVDFFWRTERIAVEIDGYRYHSSRSRFESDRRRGTHLAAHGVHVIRLTWSQVVDDSVATAVEVGQALLQARAARSHGPRHA